MNKELEQKFWEKAYDIVAKTSVEPIPTIAAISTEFANLILKECIGLVTQADDIVKINKHFGIKND